MRWVVMKAASLLTLVVSLGLGFPAAVAPVAASESVRAETPLCAPAPEALLIGDSLVARASDDYVTAFAEAGWNLTVVAYGGRTARWGFPQLEAQMALTPQPSVVIVSLGTNDTRMLSTTQNQDAALIRRYVDAVGDERTLLWANVALQPEIPSLSPRYVREVEFNDALIQVASESTNLQVLDWAGEADYSQFLDDGVHYQPTEYPHRAQWLADALLRTVCEPDPGEPGPVVQPWPTQVGNSSVSIAWNPPRRGGEPTSYVVEYSTAPSGPWTPAEGADPAATAMTITGLRSTTPYYIRVAAKVEDVVGPWMMATNEIPITSVTGGATSTCVLYADHELACAGANESGWIDSGVVGPVTLLTNVLSGVSAVSPAQGHACVIRLARAVACWGSNSHGVLGNGQFSGVQAEAIDVPGIAEAISVATTDAHTCAVSGVEGEVTCWGANSSGELGDGTLIDRTSPTRVLGLGAVRDVTVGPDFSCALLTEGSVWCWGANSLGQLGDGTQISRNQPRQVVGLSDVTQLSAADGYVCALRADATVWCWGQSGSLTPIRTPHIGGAVKITTASDHACAVLNTGSLKCWGENAYGQLGTGTTEDAPPTQVLDIQSAVSVAPTDTGSCALLVDGRLRCWGSNRDGQFGQGEAVSVAAVVAPNLPKVIKPFVRTLGIRITRLSIKTASGIPVTGGSISWSSVGAVARNPVGLTALGIAGLPSTPAGRLQVSLRRGVLPDGVKVSGTWTVWQNGQPLIALTIPDPPAPSTRYVRVNVGENRRVIGAAVRVEGLTGRLSVSGFTYVVKTVSSGATAVSGLFVARGFALSDAPIATVEYSDDVIQRRVSKVVLAEDLTVVRLPRVPYLDLQNRDIRAQIGTLVPVTARLSDPVRKRRDSQPSLAGVAVTMTPPVGVAQTCAGVTLTAKTDSRGWATLAVCATKSGTFQVSAPGAVSTACLNLLVFGGVPSPVEKVDVRSPSSGRIVVSWSPPDFIGGRSVPILSYTVLVSGGSGVVRKEVIPGSGRLRRHVHFRGLTSAKTYKVTVTATNASGTSTPVEGWAGVA
ncbi:unannotated protein [freshwater metagenome]|uniref:Unannotated protein n=1 Tax=freshwater metagenome TaxID=449393 RepID=A0A6J7G5W8_9ZZZZ|nr:hypothetical protein [Actinomycetota bacterium]